MNFQLQVAERVEVGLASKSVTIGHLNSEIFLFVTDTHTYTHTHTHTHTWVSRNVKIMNAVRIQKIETCSRFLQRANGMKRKIHLPTHMAREEEEDCQNNASDE